MARNLPFGLRAVILIRAGVLLSRNDCRDRDGGEESGEDEQPSAKCRHLSSPPVNVSHASAVKNSTQKIVQAVVIVRSWFGWGS